MKLITNGYWGIGKYNWFWKAIRQIHERSIYYRVLNKRIQLLIQTSTSDCPEPGGKKWEVITMHHLYPCSISLKHLVYVSTKARITGLVWPGEVQSFKTGAFARSSPLFCILVMPVPERNGKDGRKAKLHTNTFPMTYMLSGTTEGSPGTKMHS